MKSSTINTRIINEIKIIQEKYACIVNDHSIEVFYDDKTKYIFRELSKFPFKIPEIIIINNDINGKKWEFTVNNRIQIIWDQGQISFTYPNWSPQMKMIDLILLIEEGLNNKQLIKYQ